MEILQILPFAENLKIFGLCPNLKLSQMLKFFLKWSIMSFIALLNLNPQTDLNA